MPIVQANGIRIAYDVFGDKTSAAVLLIAGNGAQLLFWETDFCAALAATGLFVIRFDNRDVGLSTKFDSAGAPDIMAAIAAAMKGDAICAPYSLDDMADDCVGLLDALQIEKAHICGASMGGMIAQVVACRHPGRTLSLTSIMSNTGNPQTTQGNPEAIQAAVAPPPTERNAYVAHNLRVWKKIWSAGFPFEEERARAFLEKSYDRAYCPDGAVRQNLALLARGDRRPALSALKTPTLIIHGSADPLIPIEAGRETAQVIPNAKFLAIDGMGHDLPTGAWPQIIAAISNHVRGRN